MRRSTIILFLIVLFSKQTALAQADPVIPYQETRENSQQSNEMESEKYSASELDGVEMDEEKLRKRAQQLNYEEKEVEVDAGDSARPEPLPMETEGKKEVEKKGKSIWSGDSGKTIAYTLAIVFLAMVLVYFIFSLGKKRAASVPDENGVILRETQAEEAEEWNWDSEGALEKALAGGDYRLAMRILYLGNLKKLMEKGLIRPAMQKTNSDYVREMKDLPLQDGFRKLTAHFEYYWYGDQKVNKTVFAEYRGLSDTFYHQVRMK